MLASPASLLSIFLGSTALTKVLVPGVATAAGVSLSTVEDARRAASPLASATAIGASIARIQPTERTALAVAGLALVHDSSVQKAPTPKGICGRSWCWCVNARAD